MTAEDYKRRQEDIVRICGLTANAEGHHSGDPDCVCADIESLVDNEVAAAITAAVEAELRRLVPLVCSRCRQQLDYYAQTVDKHEHRREKENFWMHHRVDSSGWSEQCHAGPLHESIYQREQRDDG